MEYLVAFPLPDGIDLRVMQSYRGDLTRHG